MRLSALDLLSITCHGHWVWVYPENLMPILLTLLQTKSKSIFFLNELIEQPLFHIHIQSTNELFSIYLQKTIILYVKSFIFDKIKSNEKKVEVQILILITAQRNWFGRGPCG